eukprot:CAMPEP_0172599690 /NCGR_PEP_ID=MMETSP1068-20121228/19801_1 /TAXON_ID=35684 /ORGANISM="Pseudopedinella elastica, Strain CCMP716" /LENGTH=142 /DNA_ID=CAMNT_0013400025 /DNA_START=14 /DNA_END=442 /DNA_ORIENTATION=-
MMQRGAVLLILSFLTTTSVVSGFVVRHPAWTCSTPLKAASPEVDQDTLRSLWGSTPRSLLKIGSKGAKPSHVRSLADLLEQHGVVKVKLSDHRMDSAEAAAILAEADNAQVAEIHSSGRYILFTQIERRAPAAKAPSESHSD